LSWQAKQTQDGKKTQLCSKAPGSGSRRGEKGERAKLKNNTGTRKQGINELTTPQLGLEIKSNCVTGLLSLCYYLCSVVTTIAAAEAASYHEQSRSKRGISPQPFFFFLLVIFISACGDKAKHI